MKVEDVLDYFEIKENQEEVDAPPNKINNFITLYSGLSISVLTGEMSPCCLRELLEILFHNYIRTKKLRLTKKWWKEYKRERKANSASA